MEPVRVLERLPVYVESKHIVDGTRYRVCYRYISLNKLPTPQH